MTLRRIVREHGSVQRVECDIHPWAYPFQKRGKHSDTLSPNVLESLRHAAQNTATSGPDRFYRPGKALGWADMSATGSNQIAWIFTAVSIQWDYRERGQVTDWTFLPPVMFVL